MRYYLKRRTDTLLVLFAWYIGSLVTGFIYPNSGFVKASMIVSAAVLAIVQIYWLELDMRATEVCLRRSTWKRWNEQDPRGPV